MSHAEELRDLAAWFAVHEPARGNAPGALEAAAVDMVQGAAQLRATVAALRDRSDKAAVGLAMFLLRQADAIEAVANRLDPGGTCGQRHGTACRMPVEHGGYCASFPPPEGQS